RYAQRRAGTFSYSSSGPPQDNYLIFPQGSCVHATIAAAALSPLSGCLPVLTPNPIPPPPFRMIQVCPKDLRALSAHPEPAVRWPAGSEGEPMLDLRRRQFITLLGGAAAWPLGARAQQPDRIRRIAVLAPLAEDDPEMTARLARFRRGLEKRGWSEGRNVRMDTRFAPDSSADQAQIQAKELIALQPDVILAQATPLVTALQRESRLIPIVFASVADPIGSGFVASLPRPGGNITGVMLYEASVTGKWLAMLKEIAPRLERVA